MHAIAVQLAPILGAEKSKVPFYIAGGLLVAWALFVSLGIGARRSDFPEGLPQQRAVIAITAALVLAAVATAVITSGGATSSEAAAGAAAQTQTSAGAGGSEAPASAQTSTSSQTSASPKTSATGSAPKATTGTPAPASSPAAHASSLKLAADSGGQLSYDTKQLSATAGSVTIAFANASPLPHNLTIAQGSTVLGATPTFAGGAKSLHLALKAGKYTFYCSVPGHRQAGMEGTLTVS
jgi:plastocyanin